MFFKDIASFLFYLAYSQELGHILKYLRLKLSKEDKILWKTNIIGSLRRKYLKRLKY